MTTYEQLKLIRRYLLNNLSELPNHVSLIVQMEIVKEIEIEYYKLYYSTRPKYASRINRLKLLISKFSEESKLIIKNRIKEWKKIMGHHAGPYDTIL